MTFLAVSLLVNLTTVRWLKKSGGCFGKRVRGRVGGPHDQRHVSPANQRVGRFFSRPPNL